MAPGLCDAHGGLIKQLDRIETKLDKILDWRQTSMQTCEQNRQELQDAMRQYTNKKTEEVDQALRAQASTILRVLGIIGSLMLTVLAVVRYAGDLGRVLVKFGSG